MGSYLVQRFLLLIPTFIGVTLIGFLVMHLAPGDPAELRAAGGLGGAREGAISRNKQGSVDEALSQWRKQYGLDRPIPIQYAIWLSNLATLNFGESFKDNQSVWLKISERIPVTVKLNLLFTAACLCDRNSSGDLLGNPPELVGRSGNDPYRFCTLRGSVDLGGDYGDRLYLRRRLFVLVPARRPGITRIFF
jgi:ABC-type microcin C transport system permease subunit YejB